MRNPTLIPDPSKQPARDLASGGVARVLASGALCNEVIPASTLNMSSQYPMIVDCSSCRSSGHVVCTCTSFPASLPGSGTPATAKLDCNPHEQRSTRSSGLCRILIQGLLGCRRGGLTIAHSSYLASPLHQALTSLRMPWAKLPVDPPPTSRHEGSPEETLSKAVYPASLTKAH